MSKSKIVALTSYSASVVLGAVSSLASALLKQRWAVAPTVLRGPLYSALPCHSTGPAGGIARRPWSPCRYFAIGYCKEIFKHEYHIC